MCGSVCSTRFNKLHALVNDSGQPIHVAVTPGQRHEMTKALELLDYARGEAFIGDTGYDSNAFRAEIVLP